MTLVNARAAFEKAVTDAVAAADNTVLMVYDNVAYTTPGKTKKYITMTISFTQSTLQNQGAASDYYSGVVQCNVYVPRSAGTSVLSSLSEAVIDGLTSVNAAKPRSGVGLLQRCRPVQCLRTTQRWNVSVVQLE